ncbi:ABC transporter permease subunit [Roseomonas sp. 18066]|uniref:ABC transporter permease subunit n=1 Tax=Roseomonas sp. 18066 TaxID=2681412 RepID=UPI001F2F21AB|nr:ABC transporter permease subunit [Roseomonas sp. 18066]
MLAAVAVVAPFALGLLALAPNRLLSPRPASLPLGLPLGLPVLLSVALFLLAGLGLVVAALRPRGLRIAELLAVAMLLALLAAAGTGAAALLRDASPAARAMPAAGFWFSFLCICLAGGAAAAGRGAAPSLFWAAALLGGIVLVLGGGLDSLSLLREAAARGPEIRAALAQHLALSGGAFLLALMVAAPAALLALRHPRLEAVLMGAANAVQVVPSIALFGLLMAPLGALVAVFPVLRQWGIGGIGPAPAVLGISAYLLLPLASSSLAGLRLAPPALLEAAAGQGMTPRQILVAVRLPMGAGVMLGGLRLAAVQAVGLATLAALIGGGGLGALIFQGIGQLAADLILLGVLPVVALSLAADALLAGLQTALGRRA